MNVMSASPQAVVVGATGDIGAAVVGRLREAGVPVVAVGRDHERLEQLNASDDGITVCVADIGDAYGPRGVTVHMVEADALHGATLALDGGARRGLF